MLRNVMLGGLAATMLLVAAWTLRAEAQEPASVTTYEYAEIVGTSGLAGKVRISADFGESGVYADKTLRDAETGKAEKYLSMIDALNSMATEGGWELYAAYPISMGTTNVYHYVLRRPKR